ncbi:hypothetical protein KP509_20G077100 [Ceratopteris richardii]|uniref:Uncharacterized protein n=1 Tax=Ceratopteris richardii TaxID=49495 RepID=A0A8T2SKG0_CERRI|nr:hypothetical protein KP509_20G077100 [Ceratopteris richardii]
MCMWHATCAFKFSTFFLLDLFSIHRIEEIKEVWRKRWDWFHHPIHGMVNLLHPLWRSTEQSLDMELVKALNDYVDRLYGTFNEELRGKLEIQLTESHNKEGLFGRDTTCLRSMQLMPVTW